MSVISSLISTSLNLSQKNVENTIKLLQEGATIPFISRYRKEATGGLDEIAIEKKTSARNMKTIKSFKSEKSLL